MEDNSLLWASCLPFQGTSFQLGSTVVCLIHSPKSKESWTRLAVSLINPEESQTEVLPSKMGKFLQTRILEKECLYRILTQEPNIPSWFWKHADFCDFPKDIKSVSSA